MIIAVLDDYLAVKSDLFNIFLCSWLAIVSE